jgi:hypothetical protein
MKRLNVLVATLGLAAGAALAQPPGPPLGGRFAIDDLAVLLDLDAYQKGEVERVLTEQRAAAIAARGERAESDERPSRDEVRALREQNRGEVFTKLQNTLTEQQLAKLRILMTGPQGGRGPRGPF